MAKPAASGPATYGGQAVIEGVMMRGRRACVVAVRAPSGAIEFEQLPLGRIYRSRFASVPFVRGLVILWDALVLGMRALTFSANVQAEEESERIEGAALFVSIGLSLAIGVGLFFLLPAGTAFALENWLGWSNAGANLSEGGLRLALLIGYMALVARMPEIERVFGYHGAEHKVINAYEAGDPLTVDSVLKHSRQHMRCGTAFLLTVVLLSILAFALLGPMDLAGRLASRLLLIPLLAAVAYEFLHFTARNADRAWARWLAWPNLALQRLTTREPEPPMVEVAIAAFETMRASEGKADSTESSALAA